MEEPKIEIDLELRDAATVFARGKEDKLPGPQRESFRFCASHMKFQYVVMSSFFGFNGVCV